jgi:hypothetical protein
MNRFLRSDSTPAYTGDVQGDYFDLAECSKAAQAKAIPMIRIDLTRDRKRCKAMVTWSHELGVSTALVFKDIGEGKTRLTIFSAYANSADLAKYTKQCED